MGFCFNIDFKKFLTKIFGTKLKKKFEFKNEKELEDFLIDVYGKDELEELYISFLNASSRKDIKNGDKKH